MKGPFLCARVEAKVSAKRQDTKAPSIRGSVGKTTNEKSVQLLKQPITSFLSLTETHTRTRALPHTATHVSVSVGAQTSFLCAGQSQLKRPADVLDPACLDKQEKHGWGGGDRRGVQVVVET